MRVALWGSFAIAGAMLTGCATPVANYKPEVQQLSQPPLNSISTASIGDDLLSQGSNAIQEGLELKAQVHVTWAYTLSSGFYPKTGSDSHNAYYSFIFMSSLPGYGTLSKNPLADPARSIKTDLQGSKVCVVTVFDLYVCAPDSSGTLTRRTLTSENGLQRTLIYNGRVGDKINIGYREFSDSTARPAFSNNVEYDLSSSNIISYRGAKLRIIDANNNSITYQVLSNFNAKSPE
ncbi:MAG TPA: hypothetical protein VK801_15230 [Caulobacteraceae bacterium]|jgi:hypothetical protein|nr:hypothetical protein [Caulobacteraceae bacterium]